MNSHELRSLQMQICGEAEHHVGTSNAVCANNDLTHAFFRQEMLSSSVSNETTMKKNPVVTNKTVFAQTS